MEKHYLACDLGAESGRLVRGTIARGKLSMEEIHRFPNTPKRENGSLLWQIDDLFQELKAGLRKAASSGLSYQSISCDSWGVDYVLLDQSQKLMAPTFHYRDPRTQQGLNRVMSRTDWPTIFSETGIQAMPINTLIQLASESPTRLQQASQILGIGDAFNCFLGGSPRIEVSMASTFQLYNPVRQTWSSPLCQAIGISPDLLAPVVKSGTDLGTVNEVLQAETGIGPLKIIATCSHDTGAAVAAVPASGSHWAYLSSGTWSLMGVERKAPCLTDQCRDLNFTNEIGFGNSIRLLKNISGLWLLQESRRAWQRAGDDYDYTALTELAKKAEPFLSLVDPTDNRFVAPENMVTAIQSFCRETNQAVPETPGAVSRCILESLALLYRSTLDELATLTEDNIDRLHVVGGGSKNALLNQLTANAVQRRVITGPVEATAAGNILIQALSAGDLENLASARELMKQSTEMEIYIPEDTEQWQNAASRFESIRAGSTD